MSIFQLARSWLICLIAKCLSSGKRAKSPYFIVGSNYGHNLDPNALAIINCLQKNGLEFVYVSNLKRELDHNFVKRGTLKSARLFLGAKACFYTHSLSDILPYAHKLSLFKKIMGFPEAVFLQHGVIGLKKFLPNGATLGSYIKSLDSTFDHMIVSSDWEKEVVAEMGVAPSKLAVTGLPRFDFYSQVQAIQKKVLVFFTWQDADQLAKKYQAVLGSEGIGQLRGAGYDVYQSQHQMLLNSLSDDAREVHARELRENVDGCALLITDDSSVAWDVFYQGGDVIFFQPSSSWLIEKELLASKVCRSQVDLDRHLVAWLGSAEKEVADTGFFAYRDSLNSQRVIDLVTP